MKNWGWDIIYRQRGPLAGPHKMKYSEYNQHFEENID